MSNQGTIRLKVTNGAPAIEKLWNGRFKLEFLCDNNSPKEDWYYDNISSILPDYGILQETNFGSGVSEDWEAIPSSVYPDMRLVETEYVYIPSMGDKRVKLTYETLTASWVEEKSEDTDYELNGLKRVSRTFVALPGTTYDKVVGTSTINSDGTTLYLGSFKIEKTEARWELTEVWLEAGTLSETLDNVGSQKAKVIETIGPDPATPSGYSLASKQESDFEGFQTNRFTFLKDNVKLSQSEDKVGSQLAISQQWFHPDTNKTVAGYSLASKSTSDFEGIETVEFRFLKDNVILSESEDKVGSQLAITQEVFNGTPDAPSGYSVASEQESDVDGIPTKRFTFLKDNVILSESEDEVGSQNSIVQEVFNGTPATPSGYSVASKQESDVDGIPTKRFTFLKDNVVLSESEDKVGSQLAITQEVFNGTPTTPSGYSIANTQESDVDGIPTKRFTFLKPSILSLQQDFVGGATTVQVSAFGMTESQVDADLSEVTVSHILISQSEGDYDGITTSQFTYEVDDFEVESQAEDGMEIIVRTELSATNFTSGVIGTSTYKTLFLAQENIDNGNTIKKRTSRYSEAGVLSISPLEEDGFSLAPSYVYVTTGAPASSMTGLVKPNGTALGTNVTWFEPKVQNVEGFSTYTQQVLSIASTTTTKVHSVNKFFTITEPGIMSTGGAYNSAAKSGAATRFPEATKQPRTYRKKATVDVYLTSSNLITETEVAFTESEVDWCSIGFDSFYTNELDSTASVSSSWRSFPQYLNSSGTSDTANASTAGVYFAEANSYGAGDTTYTTTGIYRVELEKYTRAVNGTQLYLKTIVTF